jgi:integrase/recombinase XerC
MLIHIESFISFIQNEKRYSPNTVLAYKKDLEQFIDFMHSEYEIKDALDIKHTFIRSWIVQLMEQSVTARSINRKLSSLKSFYKYLIRKGIVDSSPMAKITAPKVGKKLPIVVEEKKIALLLESGSPEKNDFISLRNKLVLTLLYTTGMRRSELKNLKETDIDSYQSQIKVLGKGKKERFIPLALEVIESINNYRSYKQGIASEYLLCHEDGSQLAPQHLYRIVNTELSKVTTLEKRSPHVLRHTFATHMLNNGADINAVKEMLGHSSLSATQVYTHNTVEKLKKAYKQAHPRS